MKSALLAFLFFLLAIISSPAAEKPLLRDFMGINGHYHFRPELYRPTSSLVRNYHPMPWDIGDDGGAEPVLPRSRMQIDDGPVDWEKLYGAWRAEGYRVDASLQFEFIKPEKWSDMAGALHRYGKAFAEALGPSSPASLVEAAEIGNEPANYDDATYRRVFENLAKGLREGDAKLKIVTAAAMAKDADKYSKNMAVLEGLESLYDVINIHSYSMIEGWPTWRRVYPEHPDIPYLKVIDDLVKWCDANAPGKELWLTEFGYDASSRKPPSEGDMARWVSSTELEQAQWIVRSFLIFAALDLDRAYVYYYNDDDKPSFHASSGITRNFVPKPAYWAMAHLRKTLGDFRFSRVVEQSPELCIYEFINPDGPKEPVWAIWSPTGDQREVEKTIAVHGKPLRAERMPLKEGEAEDVPFVLGTGTIKLTISESPIYLRLSL